MNSDLIEIMVVDMRALYDLLYPKGEWLRHFYSQKEPRMSHRHMVRYLIYRERPATLEEVAEAEHELVEKRTPAPDHSTILNSTKMAKKYLSDSHAETWHKMTFYYDLVRERAGDVDPDLYLEYIREFNKEDPLVRSVVLASLLQNNLVNEKIMNVLLNEYRAVPKKWLEHLIKEV